MPNTSSRSANTFEENIDILHEELNLAAKWRRPSILLAVHKSTASQDKAEKALEARLKREGRMVTRLIVNNERADVPHLISAAPQADETIFFVSNIGWGGGQDGREAYRALNLYRELFVDNRIKAVFWLTANEAADLPRHAPDFWAFRHRFIEFSSPRTATQANLPAGLLLWDVQESVDAYDSLDERIQAREAILAKLPHNREALSTRVDLNSTLGNLYWRRGDTPRASARLNAGLDLAGNGQLPEMKARLLNGLGVLQHEAKEYAQAIETYNEALQEAPASGAILVNLSAASCMLGRNEEGIAFGKRAARASPGDAKVWNRLGHIYLAIGRVDEALACLRKAAGLVPREAAYQLSLAVAYGMVDRLDEGGRHLQLARQMAGKQMAPWLDIYEEAILGNPLRARELLEAALRAKQIQNHEVRRDPNLSLLFEASEIEALADG